MTAKKAATAKVVIRAPFKCTWAGIPYWPGTVAEVPPWVAQEWVKVGYADPVDEPQPEPTDEQADADQAEQPETQAAKPKRTKQSGHG